MKEFQTFITVDAKPRHFHFMPVRSSKDTKVFVRATTNTTESYFEMKKSEGLWRLVPPVPAWISAIEEDLQRIIEYNN